MKKNKFSFQKRIGFIASVILTICAFMLFVPELLGANLFSPETVTTLLIQSAVVPIYYDASTGRAVYSASAINAASDAAPGVGAIPTVCVCDSINPYRIPNSLTLTATSTGIGSVAKLTPFDDVAEAVQGSLGTIFFGIAEIPFGAGTIAKQDGTFIFAADNIRNITATRMLVIDKITAFGTEVATNASASLNYVRGFISGNENQLLTFNLTQTNQSAVNVLQWSALGVIAGGLLYYKSNEGFQFTFTTAAGIINLQLSIKGYQYYGN